MTTRILTALLVLAAISTSAHAADAAPVAAPAAAPADVPDGTRMTPVKAGQAARKPSAAELDKVGRSGFTRSWQVEELYREANLALNAAGRSFERGAKVYDVVLCALCHKFGGGGGGIGPDLSGVGAKFGPREILESIIEPSAIISDLYSTVTVTSVDGKRSTGRPTGSTDTATQLTLSFGLDPATGTTAWNGPVVSIPNDQIIASEESGVSPMPPGLINALTKDEIYDFLAFLISVGNPDDRMFKPAKIDFAGAPKLAQ